MVIGDGRITRTATITLAGVAGRQANGVLSERLTHTVSEARTIAEAARRHKVADADGEPGSTPWSRCVS